MLHKHVRQSSESVVPVRLAVVNCNHPSYFEWSYTCAHVSHCSYILCDSYLCPTPYRHITMLPVPRVREAVIVNMSKQGGQI